MFLSNSVSNHKSHRQYGLMDMNMINNKFASLAIHIVTGTQDLTVYYKPTYFCVNLIFVIFVLKFSLKFAKNNIC